MAFQRNRKTKRDPKTTTVGFALTAEEAEMLYAYCELKDIRVSSFVRSLVIKAINKK